MFIFIEFFHIKVMEFNLSEGVRTLLFWSLVLMVNELLCSQHQSEKVKSGLNGHKLSFLFWRHLKENTLNESISSYFSWSDLCWQVVHDCMYCSFVNTHHLRCVALPRPDHPHIMCECFFHIGNLWRSFEGKTTWLLSERSGSHPK